MHSRWAMIGVSGLVAPDLIGAPTLLLPDLVSGPLMPLMLMLCAAISGVEWARGAARMQEGQTGSRVYPGRQFDVLGLTAHTAEEAPGLGVLAPWLGGAAGWLMGGWWLQRPGGLSGAEQQRMKDAELRHGRLAMVSFVGIYCACALHGKGPVSLLLQHVADPVHNTVLQQLR